MRLVLSIIVLMLFYSCIPGHKSRSNQDSNILKNIKRVSVDFEKSSEMLDENKYWTIIEKSFLSSSDYNIQRTKLLKELTQLNPKEIIGFDLRTTKLLKDSYISEMWCAAYIMKGGCSDDAFEYFRCWLISKGKDIYYKASKNPDALSEIEKKLFFDYELEPFLYMPNEAFMLKTGKEIYDYRDMETFLKVEGYYPQIEFNWQEDNPSSMKKICPKLFQKHW